MNRIFMTRLTAEDQKNQVRLAVFLKGDPANVKDLMGFLRNQKIECANIPQQQREQMHEFAYFDDGFYINIEKDRWSFYELKSYIQSYTDTRKDDFLLGDTLHQEMSTSEEDHIFDDHFTMQLIRETEKNMLRYYNENMSIGLFVNGILMLLRQNLQLYWAAAKLMDIKTHNLSYLNHDPPSMPRNDVLKACNSTENVISVPIVFCEEHIADLFVRPGPFSPRDSVMKKFLFSVIDHIAPFVYGHLIHKTETFRLKSELAELKKREAVEKKVVHDSAPVQTEPKSLKKIKVLMMGDTHINSGQLQAIFSKFGFDRSNVDLQIDYDKYKAFDTNNLLAVRSRYDGVLLGPMPHCMKGDLTEGEGLIVQMQREPDRYPPFVIMRDKRGDLKITKNSLKTAIQDLILLLAKVGSYQE